MERKETKHMYFIMSIFISFFFLLSSLAANERPERVASLNLCTDQLVLELLNQDRIVSVTYLAKDPSISYLADRAKGLPQNHGLAEEILPLKPDLILAGAFTSRPTTSLLTGLGYRVIEFKMADNFHALQENIIKAGEILDESEKARRLVRDINLELDQITPSGRTISSVILQPSAAGLGNVSLLDDIFRMAKLTSISSGEGILGVGWLTLDRIIKAQPELIISDDDESWPSLGHLVMRHPAYRAIRDKQGRIPSRVNLPANLWNCGGPQVVKAISILVDARALVLE